MAGARLARTQRVGALTFHRLLARFKTASAGLDALPRISRPRTAARRWNRTRTRRRRKAQRALGRLV
ncbi:hypothetical protein [Vitreimonas flagellata]|uniref:hypothetical protein n=1 Tax=Vitreimonas flagellata TaxID=2560861 RepID=UPI003B83A406